MTAAAVTIRIKRRLEGEPGPPTNLSEGELAFNEVEEVLYIGTSAGQQQQKEGDNDDEGSGT